MLSCVRTPCSRLLAFVALACLAGPASAQVPDIRGLNFAARLGDFSGATDFGGLVITPLGNVPIQDNPNDLVFSFGPRPHTFEVVADPNAPNDPTHIQVQTRFVNYPAIQGYSSPDILWDLRGTYDPTTGNLSVSGAKTGTVFFNDGTGQDPFHLFPFPTAIFIQLVNPTFSLQGKVVAEPGGLEIIGTDAKPSFGSPGNITADFSRVIFTSALASEPNSGNTLLALDLVPGTGFGAFYNWRALAVPEPGALSLLACLGISSLGLAARRLRRR